MSKKKVLSQIVKENDIHNIAPADYRQLAKEIRAKLVRSVSRTGGHLASNLGAVELTMALHLCLHFPEDKLIWDVGHQSYVHKILTGRGDAFSTLRQMGGLSGFPKVKENPSDTFDTGHSSTSISVAQGFAKARDLRGGDEKAAARKQHSGKFQQGESTARQAALLFAAVVEAAHTAADGKISRPEQRAQIGQVKCGLSAEPGFPDRKGEKTLRTEDHGGNAAQPAGIGLFQYDEKRGEDGI